MGILNTKSYWICSDCSGRISTIDEIRSEFPQIPGADQSIIDYEITEFERCDEGSPGSPVSYSNTGFSSKVTITSPITPTNLRSITMRRQIISRNASVTSINIVDVLRSSAKKNY